VELSRKYVFYRDYEMTSDWPEKIRRAQLETIYVIGGREYPRVPYGCELPNWNAQMFHCHDCGIIEGELHVPGCDVEKCPACRGQAISCSCVGDAD
jgi:hypothetical protein